MHPSASVLEQIQIASPCTAAWDHMRGDERVRHCQACAKNVYNLSGMTRRQAEELVIQREGQVCVRFYRRGDGTLLTTDCPLGLAALRRPLLLVAGLAAAFLVATLGVLTAGAFVLPRLHDDGRGVPNPVQAVMDWLFPPPACVMGSRRPL